MRARTFVVVHKKGGARLATLYENIKALCDARGITGGKMCVDLGLSKSLMTGLKNGRKKSIQVETATKISEYFKVPVNVLTGEGDKKVLSENLARYMTTFDTLRLITMRQFVLR